MIIRRLWLAGAVASLALVASGCEPDEIITPDSVARVGSGGGEASGGEGVTGAPNSAPPALPPATGPDDSK